MTVKCYSVRARYVRLCVSVAALLLSAISHQPSAFARRLLFLLLLSAISHQPSAFAQGSLTPPGSPAPLFKTLQQVEPRTDLQATPAPAGVDDTDPNYHFIINQAGSYYLSANLGATKPNGIQINAAGVTLDLNGFEISRASGTGGNGIELPANSHRASIRNGSIKGFAYGIRSLFAASSGAQACAFRDLAVSNCTSHGILTAAGAVLESCRAHHNSGTAGIWAENGATLSNCVANNNTTTHGIVAEVGSTVTSCIVYDNDTGFYGISANGSTLAHCSAYRNTSSNTVSAGIKINGGSITSCSAGSNTSTAAATPTTGMGFLVGGETTIQHCTAYNNKGDGIYVTGNSLVRDNLSDGNGNAGIHVTESDNRIEGNNVTGNIRGIDVDIAGNLIIKNSASGNTTNYDIVANNVFGPIVDRTAPASAAVLGSSAASSAGTADPWANFSY